MSHSTVMICMTVGWPEPKLTPSFLLAFRVTVYCPAEAYLWVIVREVVVVSAVLSPKFHEKYEALSEHAASKITVVSVVIVVGKYMKHASVGLEHELIKLVSQVSRKRK